MFRALLTTVVFLPLSAAALFAFLIGVFIVLPLTLTLMGLHDAYFYTHRIIWPETPEQKLARQKEEWRGRF